MRVEQDPIISSDRIDVARGVVAELDGIGEKLARAKARHLEIVVDSLQKAARMVYTFGVFPTATTLHCGEVEELPYLKVPNPDPKDKNNYYVDSLGVIWKEAKDSGQNSRLKDGRFLVTDEEFVKLGEPALNALMDVVAEALQREQS